MLSLLQLAINLYEDQAGQPGALIPDNTVCVGQTFFVEIAVRDQRAEPRGVDSLWLDVVWEPTALEVIDDPFDPAEATSQLVSSRFSYGRRGVLDEGNLEAVIRDLSGASPDGTGLGVEGPERFSIIHFRADAAAEMAEIAIPPSHIHAGLIGYSYAVWPKDINVSRAGVTILPATAMPSVSVGDASVQEGDEGLQQVSFPITLSHAVNHPVHVSVSSADGTATAAGGDYVPLLNHTLTFHPGEPLTQFVTVAVRGDVTVEPDETFELHLSDPIDATINDGIAIGTITNEDDGRYAPPVAYSLLLTDAAGRPLELDTNERHRVSPGQEFVAEVRVTDTRPRQDALGIVAAYADLRTDSEWFTWSADSLVVDSTFAQEQYGEVYSSTGVVNDAGGTSAIPTATGNAGQTLFRVRAIVDPHAAARSSATVSLDAAELEGHDTRVWNVGNSVAATFQQLHVVVDAPHDRPDRGWQNPSEPLDVNEDGSVTAMDVLRVINAVGQHGALILDRPPGDDDAYIDVNGDGIASALDALVVSNFLNFGQEKPRAAAWAASVPEAESVERGGLKATDDSVSFSEPISVVNAQLSRSFQDAVPSEAGVFGPLPTMKKTGGSSSSGTAGDAWLVLDPLASALPPLPAPADVDLYFARIAG